MWSEATVGLGEPGQGWDPRAGLEVGDAAQHGHRETPGLPAMGKWWGEGTPHPTLGSQ